MCSNQPGGRGGGLDANEEGAAAAGGGGAGPGDDADAARASNSSLNNMALPSERPKLFRVSTVILMTTLFVMFSFLQDVCQRLQRVAQDTEFHGRAGAEWQLHSACMQAHMKEGMWDSSPSRCSISRVWEYLAFSEASAAALASAA